MLSLLALTALGPSIASAASLEPRQQLGQPIWGGFNITQEVLDVRNAISSPNCNATSFCVDFVAWIPKCLALHGDPGCWCSNQDPLHYCAICMSAPTDNTTNPEQSQGALTGHADYHKGCNAYAAFLNTTATSSSSSSQLPTSTSVATSATAAAASASGSSMNSGAIAGMVIGGVLGLALILVLAWLAYRWMQNKHEEAVAHPPRMSYFSAGTGAPNDDISKYLGTPRAMSETGTANNMPYTNVGLSGYPITSPGSTHTGGSPPPPFQNGYPTQQNNQMPQNQMSNMNPNPNARESTVVSDYDSSMLGIMQPPSAGASNGNNRFGSMGDLRR